MIIGHSHQCLKIQKKQDNKLERKEKYLKTTHTLKLYIYLTLTSLGTWGNVPSVSVLVYEASL